MIGGITKSIVTFGLVPLTGQMSCISTRLRRIRDDYAEACGTSGSCEPSRVQCREEYPTSTGSDAWAGRAEITTRRQPPSIDDEPF